MARLIREHGDALHADWQRFYGLRLMESLYELHSPDELVAMVMWLPDDAAFWASKKGGPEHKGWTVDRILAVLQLEAAQWHRHDFVVANSKRNSSIEKPAPIPFPGRPKVEKRDKGTSFMGIVRNLQAGTVRPANTE